MKKFFLFLLIIVAFACCFGGCVHQGELYIAPLDAILSHPFTAEEVPDFYERRGRNAQPHRNHYRSKDREWNSTYELKGGTR